MKILIVYDTKHGSTEQICKWIAEFINNKVDIRRTGEADNLEKYDLIIVGSPIYMERPLSSVTKFLKSHRDVLQRKKVVLFVVGLATFKFTASRYLRIMKNALGFEPIMVGMLPGKWRFINHMDRTKVENFVKEIMKRI
ncbi:MAG: flavodoxin domain-containing protein [Candidatus Njordarchaeia archaeon]